MSQEQQQQSASKPDDDKKDGDDLTTLLEASQRGDLTVLVASCTEAMRKLLVDNFDAEAGLDSALLRRETKNMTEDEKMMSADPSKADVEKFDKERKLKEASQKDIDSKQMKQLKSDALKVYDNWRKQVIDRISEAVKSQEKTEDQLKKQSSASSQRPQAPTSIGKIETVPERTVNPNMKFKELYPPTKTSLTKLPMNRRTLVLHAMLLLLISLEHYTAYSRVLMLNLTSSLKLPLKTFEQDEYTTAKGLLEAAKEMTADEETKKKVEENKDTRKYRVNLATAAGAAVIGIAGGLAAPLVAAGVGSVMGGLGLGATAAAGYLGSVAGSTLLVGSLFGAYGGRMTGQMMDKYAREVEDFEFLPVHSNQKTSEDQKQGAEQASEHDHKLRVTICISGWLTEKEEIVKPWRVLGTGAEVFALKWELEALLNLGNAMNGMVTSAAWGMAQSQLIQQTVFADLMSAFWPLGLLKVARVLDNPFSVAKSRADKAGEVLADALINRAQGERPVSLIGYSLGGRMIYSCLQSLAKRKAFGLIENAVIIGAPCPSDMSDWRGLRTAVSGRLINVFSENDYLLGFMYRTSALQYGVAGLQKIEGLAGIENVDVSEDIDGHTRYRFLVGGILKKIGFEDVDMDAVQEERETLDKIIKQEQKQSLQAQRKRLMRRQSNQGKQDDDEEAEYEATEIEKQVKDATRQSLVTRVIEYFYAPKVGNIKDAAKAADSLGKTANKTATDARTYSEYVMSKLPSMPGGGTGSSATKEATKLTDQASKTAGGAAATGQTYLGKASEYIPTSLPTLPSFGRSTGAKDPKKGQTGVQSQPAEAAKKVAGTAQSGAEAGGAAVSNVLKPTVQNTLNIQDNPAIKAAKDTTKKAPIIHQASDKVPGLNQAAGKTSEVAGTTVKNTTGLVQGTLNTVTSKAPEPVKNAATATGLRKEEEKSYMSRAAGYLPARSNLPTMPSMSGWGSSGQKKPAPKLQKRESNSGQSSAASAKDGAKSPPPKLSRTASGVKSPPPTPKRMDSGIKSPPPKLGRSASGLTRQASEQGKNATAAATGAASQVGEQGKNAGNAATGAVGQVGEQGKKAGGAATGAASAAAGQVGEQGKKATGAASGMASAVTSRLPFGRS